MRIDNRRVSCSRLLVSVFHRDAGAANLSTKLHVPIITRSLWRVDAVKRLLADHRIRHCCTSMQSLAAFGADAHLRTIGTGRSQGSG
jgi:hypothetical protein